MITGVDHFFITEQEGILIFSLLKKRITRKKHNNFLFSYCFLVV